MVGFLTRMALLSLIGILMNPAAFKARIPTAAQIAHIQHEIDSASKLRRLIVQRVAIVRGNIHEVQSTVKAIDVAYQDIHKQFAETAREEKALGGH